MKKSTILLLMLFSAYGFAQELLPTYVFRDSAVVKADAFVGVDKFGYSYFISNNAFIKFKDQETIEYKNVTLGKIRRVDIANPLLIVLFYENFNTAVLLDNQMNEIKQINFSEIKGNSIVANAVGLASQNRLWISDNMTLQLGLYDYSRNIYQTLTTPLQSDFSWYQTNYNNFTWIDDNGHGFRCDVFGKIVNLGELPAFSQMQFIADNTFVYSDGHEIFLQDLGKKPIKIYTDVNKTAFNFYYKDQILSIFTTAGITNYQITIP